LDTIWAVTAAGSRDGLVDDAVVAGEHHRQRPLDGRRMAALPGGEPFRDLLQAAERAGRLGQLGLALARRGAASRSGGGISASMARMAAKEGRWRACIHVGLAFG
jgi:hypothetical protein